MTNRILKTVLGFLLLAGVLAASPLCTVGTMDPTSYAVGGFACQMGTIEFSNFTLSIGETNVGSNGTQALPPSKITVTPNILNSTLDFGINPATWYNQDNIAFSISFQALETDLTRRINNLATSFQDNIVRNDLGTATLANSASCTSGCNAIANYAGNSVTAGDGGAGSLILGGTGLTGPISLVLQVNMNLPANDTGSLGQIIHFSAATATVGDTTFHGGLPPQPSGVPEPSTLALLAGGLLFTGLRKRFAR